MHYYEVAPTKIVRTGSDFFTYHHEQMLQPGQLVVVPVGSSFLAGVVLKSAQKPAYDTRPIEQILAIPPLPLPLLKTALWLKDYYAAPLASVLQTILPRGLTKKKFVDRKSVV